MKKIDFPVMNVRMVPADKIVANDYNPNRMASPELKLLKISIEEDGYTPVSYTHLGLKDLMLPSAVVRQ